MFQPHRHFAHPHTGSVEYRIHHRGIHSDIAEFIVSAPALSKPADAVSAASASLRR
jgi:hypothetical protein